MKLKPHYIQRDCAEGEREDLRQARAVLKYKPDIILFEMPAGEFGPTTVFNGYPTNKKPLKKVDAIIKRLRKSAKEFPYARSDIAVWENVKMLWSAGHDVQIFNINAPDKLRREYKKKIEPAHIEGRRIRLFLYSFNQATGNMCSSFSLTRVLLKSGNTTSVGSHN